MFRCLIVVAAVVCGLDCTVAEAQQFRHRAHNQVRPTHQYGQRGIAYTGPYGYGFGGHSNVGNGGYGYPGAFAGYGYVYDPYATGSFRAPDLLDDPFFQAQHKFDSRFPGRYPRRSPLVLRKSAQ